MNSLNLIKTSSAENLQADVVVIGGGGSGMAAAIAAVENGVNNVMILEARRVPGGNAVFPGGIFAAESQLQKSLGIDARKDKLFKKAMDYANWKTNPRLVRTLVDKSGDTIRWLEEKGVKFAGVYPLYPDQDPPTFHVSRGPGTTGKAIVQSLVRSCNDLGVQFLCQTKARKLLTSQRGDVIGVLAKTKDKEIGITAKSVIIATGGFAGNKKLLKKYFPAYSEKELPHTGIPHKGDGLIMATEVGAATDFSLGTVVLEMFGPMFMWSWDSAISHLVRRPNTIWVNKKGERFTNETVAFLIPEAANTIYRQPDETSYTLFDEKIKQIMFEEGPLEYRHLIKEKSKKSWQTGLDKDLRLHADKERIKIADSWEEIAKWMGVVPEILKSTIDEYNSSCDRGYDEIFGKDKRFLLPLNTPPYYAIQCSVHFVVTHGGIKINPKMEVLNHEDNPIRGLYAAGVETGGTDANTYDLNLAGHSFGFTINTGRIAGESAAGYVLGKAVTN